MRTQIIAGHTITLEAGKNYLATRPMASRKYQTFPVNIYNWTDNNSLHIPVIVIQDLTYEQANEFVNEFNNGPTSFDGRIW